MPMLVIFIEKKFPTTLHKLNLKRTIVKKRAYYLIYDMVEDLHVIGFFLEYWLLARVLASS